MRILAKAAWVYGRQLACDVCVDVEGGVISAVGVADASACADLQVDLLLPGFINAHCHLEYTALAGKLPRGAVPFGDWLDQIVSAKGALTQAEITAGIESGMEQLLAGGCTTVIDSTTQTDLSYIKKSALRQFVLIEVLGLTPERAQQQMDSAKALLADQGTLSETVGVGINPHAPYSVGPELRQALRQLLAERPELICAWHLAETADEEELLSGGTGSMSEFLSRRGLPSPTEPLGPSKSSSAAIQLLRENGLLDRCDLAFHMNAARDADWAEFRAPRAVVHCPGTHGYFDRPPFPMVEALRAGANVCLGTDSLASSDSLSMLEMLRLAADEFPFLSGGQLLDMVTRNPARCHALAGLQPPAGVLQRSYAADFVCLSGPANSAASFREVLCDKGSRITDVFISGQRRY